MKTNYQSIILTVIALCLVVITLFQSGVIQPIKPQKIRIEEVGDFSERAERGHAVPVFAY